MKEIQNIDLYSVDKLTSQRVREGRMKKSGGNFILYCIYIFCYSEAQELSSFSITTTQPFTTGLRTSKTQVQRLSKPVSNVVTHIKKCSAFFKGVVQAKTRRRRVQPLSRSLEKVNLCETGHNWLLPRPQFSSADVCVVRFISQGRRCRLINLQAICDLIKLNSATTYVSTGSCQFPTFCEFLESRFRFLRSYFVTGYSAI